MKSLAIKKMLASYESDLDIFARWMMTKPVVPMAPGASFDFNMADWVKLLIADCLIVFGRVEQKAIEIVWAIERSDAAQRVKVARRPVSDNFKTALSNRNGVTVDQIAIWEEAFINLANLRNLMAHGAWLMVDGRPWVVWHKFIVDNEAVVGEFCDRERFEAFKRQATRMLKMLSIIHNDVVEATGINTSALSSFPK